MVGWLGGWIYAIFVCGKEMRVADSSRERRDSDSTTNERVP